MIIQFNTDNNIKGSDELKASLEPSIIEGLKRYASHITRVEVHLSDENGPKEGKDAIRCLLEARVEGHQPVAVTDHADSKQLALKGAIEKLKSALGTVIGKAMSH